MLLRKKPLSISKINIFKPPADLVVNPPETKLSIKDIEGSEVIYSSGKDVFCLVKFGNVCSMQVVDRIDAYIDWYRALPDSGVFSAFYNPLYPEANTGMEKDGPEASVGGFISYVLSPDVKTIYLGAVVKPSSCNIQQKSEKEIKQETEKIWNDEKKHEKSIFETRNKKRRLYSSFTSRLGGLLVSTSVMYNHDTGSDDVVFAKRKENIMLGPFLSQPVHIHERYVYHNLEDGGIKKVRSYGFFNVGNLLGKMNRGTGNVIKGSPIDILVVKKMTTDIAKNRKDFEDMGRDARLSTVLKGLAGARIPCSLNVLWEPVWFSDFKERLHRDDKYSQMKSRDRQVTEMDNLRIGFKYSGVSRTVISPLQDQDFMGQTYRTQGLWRGLQRGLFNANILLAVAAEAETLEESIRQLDVHLHMAAGVMRASFDSVALEIVQPEDAMKALYLLAPVNFEKEDDGLVHDMVVTHEILSVFGHLPDFPLPADVDLVKFPDVQGRLTRRNLGLDKSNLIYFARAIQDFKHVGTVGLDAINDPRLIGVVSGKIGSGKTNTMLRILKETLDGDDSGLGAFSDVFILDRHGEYHKLCSLTDAEIFIVPLWSSEVIFQINILEPVEGRTIGQAIEDSATLFKHTMAQVGPVMEDVCRGALHDIYDKYSWNTDDVYLRKDPRGVPTCRDLLDHIKHGRYWELRKQEGMKAEASQRYREALYSVISRLEKILAAHGEKIFCPENGRSTVPPSIMFRRNVIIQFMFGNNNPIDDDAKNFVSLMFVQHLWNYRQINAIKVPDDRYDRKKYYGYNEAVRGEIIKIAMQNRMVEACHRNGITAHHEDFIVTVHDDIVVGEGTIKYEETSYANININENVNADVNTPPMLNSTMKSAQNDNQSQNMTVEKFDFGEGFTFTPSDPNIDNAGINREYEELHKTFRLLIPNKNNTTNAQKNKKSINIICRLPIETVMGAPRKIHTLVIEEAHNIAQERRDDPNEISLMSRMLSEIRKFGEGIWIIDQDPEMLEERVMKLANSLIVHKTDEDFAVAKISANLGILEEPHMYEFLKILSPGMALIKLNGSQATYPVEVCYPRFKIPELTQNEIIGIGRRFRDICMEDEKNFIPMRVPDINIVKHVYDSTDAKKESFGYILRYDKKIELRMANQKFAVLSIAAYFEYFDKSFKTREEFMNEYRKMWGRDMDETQISEVIEMGLLEEKKENESDGNEIGGKIGSKGAMLFLTEKGKRAIASSPHLFQAPLYYHYSKEKENPEKEKENAVGQDNIFSGYFGLSEKEKNKGIDKNNNQFQLSHRPPFAFIITGIVNIGVMSRIEALNTAIDMLKNKSMQEVILVYEDDSGESNLKDLSIPGLHVMKKKEIVDMIEKGGEAV